MTKRKDRKALTRWEADTRVVATAAGRSLVLAITRGDPVPVTPYNVGVVLGPGEQPWSECPARFVSEPPPHPTLTPPGWPPIRSWLVTSERVVGRLGDGRLYGWRWDQIVGCRVDLTPGHEHVGLDLNDRAPLVWTGPGIAALAVAAIYHLHGPHALLDHPGLSPLRGEGGRQQASSPRPLAELAMPTLPSSWWL